MMNRKELEKKMEAMIGDLACELRHRDWEMVSSHHRIYTDLAEVRAELAELRQELRAYRSAPPLAEIRQAERYFGQGGKGDEKS